MLSGTSGQLAPGLAPQYFVGETLISYAGRIGKRLGMKPEFLWGVAAAEVKRTGLRNSGKSMLEETSRELRSLCSRMSGLRPEELPMEPLRPAGRPSGSEPASRLTWHACQKCTSGDVVQLAPANRALVCTEHQCWIGPSVEPKRQPPSRPAPPDSYHSRRLSEDVLRASASLEGLIKSQQANWRLTNEVFARIASAKRRQHRGAPAPSDLPLAVTLLEVLTDPGLHHQILDPGVTFQHGYLMLAQTIASHIPRASWAVIDQAWLLLRPTFVWYRSTQLGEKGTGQFQPMLPTNLGTLPGMYPLEPMERYLDCLRTRNRTDDQWWSDRFAVPLADRDAERLLMCAKGHVQSRRQARARKPSPTDFHCSICTGQRVISGYNSLGDVMPYLALEWDQEANGELTPHMISPGSNRKVAWKDQFGHPYKAYVTNRTVHGTGCPYCASKAVLAGHNDLATTHPELAALWDFDANGELQPTDVSAGNTATIIHLRCPNGHSFSRTPAKLVEAGGRCQKCHGKVLLPGTNDLATVRPDVADWWDGTRNGLLTPDQLKAGSETKVTWLCPDGHSFEATPADLCGKTKLTCPVDTGRLLMPGTNDLATKEPDLVKDWDYKKNGFGPDTVVPGTALRSWICKHSHEQDRSVVNRRRAGGCTRCPPEERVAAGLRKNTRGRQGWDKRMTLETPKRSD